MSAFRNLFLERDFRREWEVSEGINFCMIFNLNPKKYPYFCSDDMVVR